MRTFAALLVLLVVMVSAGSALASEVSREQYRTAAEPICRASTLPKDRALAKIIKEVRQGMLSQAGARFGQAAESQARAVKQLRALAQPVADEALLGRWLLRLSDENKLMAAVGRKLDAGNEKGAMHPLAHLQREGLDGGIELLGFGFHYCQLLTKKVV
jgi:hypothetical protein